MNIHFTIPSPDNRNADVMILTCGDRKVMSHDSCDPVKSLRKIIIRCDSM